jgi:hypothetical protein
MSRLPLAGLLVLLLALARAGARAERNVAYGSLVGMADSASGDKGPQAGEIPPDDASGEASKTEYGSARIERRARKASAPGAKREAAKDDDAPSVSVPAAPAPRVWTRLFSSLIPAMSRGSSFDVAASTAARRAGREGVRPATAASAAGSAQGLLELVAAATAPAR